MRKTILAISLLIAGEACAQGIDAIPVPRPYNVSKCYQGCGSWDAAWMEDKFGAVFDVILSTDQNPSITYDQILVEGGAYPALSFQVQREGGGRHFYVRARYSGVNSGWTYGGWVYNDGQDCF